MSLNLIPHTSTPLAELLTQAAFAPLDNVGWIRVTGEDRVRWLNGMVTNSIQSLKPGEGCYCFFLNAQGRIQGDCTAWMMEDSILLETTADRIPALMAMLDRFIIMDDLELADVSLEWAGLTIIGPEIAPLLDKFVSGEAATLSSLQSKQFSWMSHADILIHANSPLTPSFEIWFCEPGDAYTLGRELKNVGVLEVTSETLEHLRILSGTPLFGVDIRDKDLPQETNQTRALHFAKGCYLGQEIVERIRSRGAVHRTFTGFILHGDLPPAGTILSADGKPIGELTSVTSLGSELRTLNSELSDQSPLQIALGYIRREALERNAAIIYPGGTAIPTALPFQLPELRALHV